MIDPPLLPVPAADLLPHSGRMCCLDALISACESGGEALVRLSPGHILLGKHGLEECGYVELAAQAAGTLHGYFRLKAGRAPRQGFLAGAQDFKIFARANVNDVLTIRVNSVAEVGEVTLLESSIWRKNEPLAEGKLKIYTQPDEGTV